jgi:uncharacterized membrane protein
MLEPPLPPSASSSSASQADPDPHWNSAVIYFNKADDNLLVPKRPAYLGWTLNFGHKLAPHTLVALLVLPPLLAAAAVRRRRL